MKEANLIRRVREERVARKYESRENDKVLGCGSARGYEEVRLHITDAEDRGWRIHGEDAVEKWSTSVNWEEDHAIKAERRSFANVQ